MKKLENLNLKKFANYEMKKEIFSLILGGMDGVNELEVIAGKELCTKFLDGTKGWDSFDDRSKGQDPSGKGWPEKDLESTIKPGGSC